MGLYVPLLEINLSQARYRLVLPKPLEPLGAELRVSHGVPNIFVPQVLLHGARVVAVVGELVAGGMPQHVRMNREGEGGELASAREELSKRRRRQRPATQVLNLLDVRGSGCLEIGAPTDAARARHLAAGQALGRAVYEEHRNIDAFLYPSRLTGEDCLAVFDRAVEKLIVLEASELKDHPQLPMLLEQLRIQLVDD